MNRTIGLTALALAVSTSPLAAQIVVRDGGSSRTGTTAREGGRIETTQDRIEAARTRAGIESRRASGSSRVPPGHLPPRGMCRVWIDGVPPGHQPAVTDCATAERNRVANSRVIYGDSESFPGKGKGKFKGSRSDRDRTTRQCSIVDGVVVGGRVIDICRDDTVNDDRRSRSGRIDRDDDRWDDDDDDDRGNRASGKAAKARGKSGGKGRGHQ